MSLSRRQSSKPPPLPSQLTEAEMDENGLHGESGEPLIPFPPLRTPLHSIPDPSQNPSEGELKNSSTVLPNFGSPKLTLGNTRSMQATPSRSTPRNSWRNGDRPPRRSSVCRSLREGVGDVMSWSEVKPIEFELEEDSTLWGDQNVKVLIRILPINSVRSTLEEYGRCVRQESSKTLIWTGHPEMRFTFDNVACETTSQERFFKAVGLPMVENCLSGYNSCMFAYGQTGSGKTYTMMGDVRGGGIINSEARGMTPRIFECLFTRIREEENNRRDEKLKYSCKCSFLEIYNEQITDLLDPSSRNLQLREDVKKGVYVENLREYEVDSVEDVTELLLQGSANRKVAATNMNSESSRSHSLFTCTIESKWERDGMKHLRFSRLNLVDLAGSERQKSSRAEGERLKEATSINKSLSTLSLVIMTLVDVANGKHRHVPYRDSKLTFLLQDSLGGNSKTIIIANVNPSVCSANETLSTLKFAQRAKLIQNNAKVNEDASGDEVALQRQIQKLKDQVSFLMNYQNNRWCGECRARSSVISGMENVQLDCDMNSLLYCGHKTKVKNVDPTFVGSLRKEKKAEDAIQRLETEIKHLSHLVSEREDDAQRAKEVVRLREEKITRLELLVDGLLSAEDYLAAENDALSEEIQLLRTTTDRIPELTRLSLENVRLLNQIRKYQELYESGQRETLLSEMSELHNQDEITTDVNISIDSTERTRPVTVSFSESMNKHIKDAKILNRQLQHHDVFPELSLQHEINKSQKEFEGESNKLLISLQEELFKLQQEIYFKDENYASLVESFRVERDDLIGKLYSVTQENTKLLQIISAKEAENKAVAEDWEKAIVYLASFLADGQQSLQDASEQIETIINSLPYHSTWVTEHIQRGLNVFLDKESLILNLQNKLVDAQRIGLEMMSKMESLKGATLVITKVEHAQDDENEAMDDLLMTEGLHNEKIPTTYEVKDLLKYKDNETSEVGFVLPGRDEDLMRKGPTDINNLLYQHSTLQAIGTLTTKLGRRLSTLRARIEEHCFSGKSIEMESQITSQVRQDINERENDKIGELNHTINVLLINGIGYICDGLKEVQDQITELVGHCLISNISYLGGNGLCRSTGFQNQTLDSDCGHRSCYIANLDVRPADSLLLKFQEAQETMKEADAIMNALLELNENTRNEKNMWKQASETLTAEKSALLAELEVMKVYNIAAKQTFKMPGHQLNQHFVEILDMLSSFKGFLKQVHEVITEELKVSYLNILLVGEDLFQSIRTSRSCIEDILCELIEKDFALFALNQCYIDAFAERNRNFETEQLGGVLSQVQRDLSTKTAEIEEIVIQKEKLESQLADCELAFNNTSADLKQATEKLTLLLNENAELKALSNGFYSKNMEAETVIQSKDKVIDGLEREILYVNASLEDKILSSVEGIEEELEKITDERDCLSEEVIYLKDKLEMASALADENEAIAIEVRENFEASKVYAQQKDAEVKILENSIEELEETIDVLERKVHCMVDEVEGHRIIRGELEKELQELKQRILMIETASEVFDIAESGEGKHIRISRSNDDIVELRNARNYIRHLEEEKGKRAVEIDKYRKHIAELVMHSEKQSALYQQKFKLLEKMVHEATDAPQNSVPQTILTANKMERGLNRTRRSGSPFKCISSIIQQMNIEKEQELSVARIQIEELESLATTRQKEVCKLNARLEAVDHMTHDVLRDLLEVKLDMGNYANFIDQHELQNLLENVQHLNEEINAKDQEIFGLRRDIESLLEERDSWIEEVEQLKEDILATKVASERFQQQDQLLKAQNKMLKIDKGNLTQRIGKLDLTISKLVGAQSIQDLIQQSDNVVENNLQKVDDGGFIRRLAKTDQLLNLAKNERATVFKQKAKHWKE